MNPPSFVLERFFAQYEFSANHNIFARMWPYSRRELLIMCAGDKEMLTAWDELSLGMFLSACRARAYCSLPRRSWRPVITWHVRGGGAVPLRFDVDDLAATCAAVGGKVKLIVVNFPHNPTGCQLTESELMRVVAIARSCGAFVLGDEMYRGLVYGDSPPLPAMCEGMSKVYALRGLRVGWLVSQKANGRAIHTTKYLIARANVYFKNSFASS
ncbi:hypothetical protein EMIHUDRAFT_226010 [Emiliania huxleyi CCMP1516]|uniref:Aminotransferase class I/classII large domain-containing protein n=2 Tax=Emiliania huxleyi TaxID=2903 RepID=A0A0D3KMP4_EMIH1|nr:hypothetical protein EMIHUDRAFT_226010 [Emiliania huxleyi CCMP1516]EOD37029.1 hypothetical protein EMIHUDRAFT_226010 [Emiliania huxleyi CCMP1516]|eukprot:XP_005789458.1 hypothetical protein EMIHUDRAFT_226010 [Emiliania huxleyi CCMP1516]